MKSERRHELKENALEHELFKLWEWVKKHANSLSWGLLALAVVALIVVWVWRSHQSAALAEQTAYESALQMNDSAERTAALERLIDDAKDRGIASDAARRVGDAYAFKALRTTDAERADAIAKSQAAYMRVINNFGDQTDSKLNAEYGLAELMLTAGKFDEAKSWYERLKADAPMGNPLHERAMAALDAMPRFTAPVSVAATRPTTTPASGPTSSIAPTTGAAGSAPASRKAMPATAPSAE